LALPLGEVGVRGSHGSELCPQPTPLPAGEGTMDQR
jgi:hypothetical protein